MKKKILYGLGALLVGYLFLILLPPEEIGRTALGGFKPGTVLKVATTSRNSVGTTATAVFATSTCAARIVSTVEKPVMIIFSNYANQTPSGVLGHLQSASTTVVYDAGLYGCEQWSMYGFDASSFITVTELR